MRNPDESRSKLVVTASVAVWQPAVLGSTVTPHRSSTPSSPAVPPAGSTRRSATVTTSVPDAAIASCYEGLADGLVVDRGTPAGGPTLSGIVSRELPTLKRP